VQQRDRINQIVGECNIYQESWINSRVHSKAMDKVVDRCRYDELKKRELQEQKELDERAMQLGLVRGDD
jgi:flagellar biosynthesis chaperone FliJ